MVTKEFLLEKLGDLTKKMEIPVFRRQNPRWLSRNLSVRNSKHPNHEEAMVIVKELLRRGI
jgi:hypothetical protein